MSGFFLGCAVWAYRPWVGDFYPTGSRSSDFLRLYGDRLTAVEGNTTFYSVPGAAMVQRWAAATPETFQFCLKLPREISHGGLLAPALPAALGFLTLMQPLGPRLGPVFMQLPPWYGPDQREDLSQFLAGWPPVVALAVEVRHPDWFKPQPQQWLQTLLNTHGMARVLLDTRALYDGPDDPQATSQRKKPNLPLQPQLTTDWTLVRWITHPEAERNSAYAFEWAQRVARWLKQGTRVYFFVHCPVEARSPSTARQFQALLAAQGQHQGIEVPPLPWNQLAAAPNQLRLF